MSKSASNSPTPTPSSAIPPTLRPTTPTTTAPDPIYHDNINHSTTTITATTTSTFTYTISPSLRSSSAQDESRLHQQESYQPFATSTSSSSSHHPHHLPQSPQASSIASSSRLPPSRGPSSSPEHLIRQREVLMAKRPRDEPVEVQRRSIRARTNSTSSHSHAGSMADTEEHREGDSTSTSVNVAPEKKKRTRTLTTPHQSSVLHNLLAQSRFPTTAQREEVGRSIGLSARKVQIWFQNQRQKARRPVRGGAPPPTPGQHMQTPQLGNPGGDYQQQYYRPQPPPSAGPYAYTGHYYEPYTNAQQHHVSSPSAPPPPYQYPQMGMSPPSLSGPGIQRDSERGDFQSPLSYEEGYLSPRRRLASRHRYSSPSPPRGFPLVRDHSRTLAPISFQVREPQSFSRRLPELRHEGFPTYSPRERSASPPVARRARSPSPQQTGSAILRGQRYDPVRGTYVPIRRDDPSSPP